MDGVREEGGNSDRMSCPTAGVELLVPAVSDVVLKYTWHIKKYSRAKQDSFDSPAFELNANGVYTRWNLSIRYWKGPEGKRVPNPVVLCLNLLSSIVADEQQARVRFQFGVWNAELRQWELCTLSRVAMQLQTSKDMLSVGYRDLSILPRHLDGPKGDVVLGVKLQLVPAETERHSLGQDLGRILYGTTGDILVIGDGNRQFHAHSAILAARSPVLAAMLPSKDNENRVEVTDMDPDILKEVLRYIYTDRVENLEAHASTLLAAAERLTLPGLKEMCERSLIETITPESVASLLLVADQFNCEALKRTALAYCEDNATSIKRSLAWRVMEVVNPDLFMEVCEAGLGSSISSNLDSLPSDTDITGL